MGSRVKCIVGMGVPPRSGGESSRARDSGTVYQHVTLDGPTVAGVRAYTIPP